MVMVVRDFEIEDHNDVLLVARESWIFAYSNHYSTTQIDNRLKDWYSFKNHENMVTRMFLHELHFKVCLVDDRIEGYVAGEIPSFSLLRLYVRPSKTRIGIGGKLLNGFLSELENSGAGKCVTSCDRHNQVGLRFYHKNGFRQVGEDVEDFHLEKELRGS